MSTLTKRETLVLKVADYPSYSACDNYACELQLMYRINSVPCVVLRPFPQTEIIVLIGGGV